MTTETPIRVLLLEDHEVVRDGLAAILSQEPDLQVVAQARTMEEALPLLRDRRPDVALVDLRLPGAGGASFIAAARAELATCRCVVLTTYDSDQDILTAFRAGADAYLLKDSFRAEVVEAIRTVFAGRRHVSAQLSARLRVLESERSLSPRELEVLQLVAQGESNKLIGVRLGLSEATVKTHLVRIYEKLGVSDRTSAVTAAIARGLLRP